jgi:hypothetical protein
MPFLLLALAQNALVGQREVGICTVGNLHWEKWEAAAQNSRKTQPSPSLYPCVPLSSDCHISSQVSSRSLEKLLTVGSIFSTLNPQERERELGM